MFNFMIHLCELVFKTDCDSFNDTEHNIDVFKKYVKSFDRFEIEHDLSEEAVYWLVHDRLKNSVVFRAAFGFSNNNCSAIFIDKINEQYLDFLVSDANSYIREHYTRDQIFEFENTFRETIDECVFDKSSATAVTLYNKLANKPEEFYILQ